MYCSSITLFSDPYSPVSEANTVARHSPGLMSSPKFKGCSDSPKLGGPRHNAYNLSDSPSFGRLKHELIELMHPNQIKDSIRTSRSSWIENTLHHQS